MAKNDLVSCIFKNLEIMERELCDLLRGRKKAPGHHPGPPCPPPCPPPCNPPPDCGHKGKRKH